MAEKHEFVERPWGGYEIISDEETPGILIKKLTFKGGFIRYQRHTHRAEHWSWMAGRVMGFIGDLPVALWKEGDTLIVPARTWHWFGGVGEVLEVWHGQVLDEDDIEIGEMP